MNLSAYHTFGISVQCQQIKIISNIEEAKSALSGHFGQLFLILGEGSNILFTKDFEGIVFKNEIKGIEIVFETENEIIIKAYSGEIWHELVMHCLQNNWGGIENLSLIPGTIGASPIQNIGAYGVELADVLESVQGFYVDSLEEFSLSKAECKLGYRDSIFKNELKGKVFITSIQIKLTKAGFHQLKYTYGNIQDELERRNIKNPTIKDISESVVFIRQTKLPNPKEIGNAGSFFKNPVISKKLYLSLPRFGDVPHYVVNANYVKIPAGWLIEQCGWKGYKLEDAGVHKNQALVLVNYGKASGQEIFNLSQKIIESVKETFSISLEREVNLY